MVASAGIGLRPEQAKGPVSCAAGPPLRSGPARSKLRLGASGAWATAIPRPPGGLPLRRRLPHRRTLIGGGWPTRTRERGTRRRPGSGRALEAIEASTPGAVLPGGTKLVLVTSVGDLRARAREVDGEAGGAIATERPHAHAGNSVGAPRLRPVVFRRTRRVRRSIVDGAAGTAGAGVTRMARDADGGSVARQALPRDSTRPDRGPWARGRGPPIAL